MEKSFYIGEEENLKPKPYGKKAEYIPGDKVELIPDPDTENTYRELFGEDAENISLHKPVIETEKEKEERLNELVDMVEGGEEYDSDYFGDPNDDHLLEIEREELMKKYDTTTGTNNVEDHREFITDLTDEPVELKRESMNTETRRKLGRLDDGRGLRVDSQSLAAERLLRDRSNAPMLGRDNLKTMSDNKKQRTFRERIKKFLDLN